MTVYLGNTLPNSWLPQVGGLVEITGIDQAVASGYAGTAQSIIGHESVATTLGQLLGCHVPCNRQQINPVAGDRVILGVVETPRRLAEGQKWSEEELAAMPVKWLLVEFVFNGG